MMTNILLIHEGEMPTLEETYRSFQYLVNNYEVSLSKINSNDFSDENMNSTDVIICVRGHSPLTYFIISEAQRLGKKVFYVLDDDLKDMPKGSFWFPGRRKWLLKCIGLCDGLFTPNKLIGEEYKSYLKEEKVIIVNTAVDPQTIQLRRNDEEITKIVMAASEWHTSNFVKYVKQACVKLAKVYKSNIEFYFVGLNPPMKEIEGISKVNYIPSMNMQGYVEYMTYNKFDIGIAVLNPNHFNERKYFNKFIEYTRYGICGVYSKCMPFELVVKDCENGLFAENSEEAWFVAIQRLIDEPGLRRSCIENAQVYLRTRHSEEYLFSKMVKDCPDLINFNSVRVGEMNKFKLKMWRIKHGFFRICESIYLTCSSVSHFGIGATVEKIKRKIQILGGKR